MKRLITILLLTLLAAGAATAQGVRPDQRPEITAPVASDDVYSQARGTLYRIRMDTLRRYLGTNIDTSTKAYTPGSGTIPAADRYTIITAADGNKYYIDRDKDYVQLSGTSAGNPFSRATLTGTGLSVDVEYSGSVATLADPGTAYTFTIPTGAMWNSAVFSGTSAAVSGSNFTLDVVNADGHSDYFTFQIINEDTGSYVRLSDWGIQVQTSTPAAGTVRYVFTNMSGLSAGWKIIATR